MAKSILLRILEQDVTALADLLEEEAPKTCEIVWERLPVESRLVHGMYSGPELFIFLAGFPPAPPENQVSRAVPGDVGYWHSPGGLYASQPDELAELVFAYDRGVEIKGA